MPDTTVDSVPEKLSEVIRWAPSYHDRKTAILHNYRKSTEHYLICGKLLCDADRGNDWKHDGSCASGFFQWVEHELQIKRSQAQRMMNIWLAFKEVIVNHMALVLQVDFSKLALIAPYVKKLSDEDSKLGLLHTASANTMRDLEMNLKELSGGIVPDTCECSGAYEVFHKCKTCGKFNKIS